MRSMAEVALLAWKKKHLTGTLSVLRQRVQLNLDTAIPWPHYSQTVSNDPQADPDHLIRKSYQRFARWISSCYAARQDQLISQLKMCVEAANVKWDAGPKAIIQRMPLKATRDTLTDW